MAIHDTKQGGNIVLRNVFDNLSNGNRHDIPPFFYFEYENGRNRRFVGLLVPGSEHIRQEDWLIAIWRMKNGERYQNYKAFFTILDTPQINREWIDDLRNGNGYDSPAAPAVWRHWVDNNVYRPLIANDSVLKYRTPEQQLPSNKEDIKK